MTYIFFIALFACLARAAGGGLWAKHLQAKKDGGVMPFDLTILSEIAFGLITGAAVGWHHGLMLGALAAVSTFFAFNTGHGTVLDPAQAAAGRKQFLSNIVDSICEKRGWPLGSLEYCWIFMGIKGAWIGAFLLPYGALLALLWPACYMLLNGTAREWVSGGLMGLVVALYL